MRFSACSPDASTDPMWRPERPFLAESYRRVGSGGPVGLEHISAALLSCEARCELRWVDHRSIAGRGGGGAANCDTNHISSQPSGGRAAWSPGGVQTWGSLDLASAWLVSWPNDATGQPSRRALEACRDDVRRART